MQTGPATSSRHRIRPRWVVLLALGLLVFGYVWLVRRLPFIAVAELGRLTNTRWQAKSFDMSWDGSVLIRELTIRPIAESPYDNTVLKAAIVKAQFSLPSLFRFKPRLVSIEIDQFLMDIQFDLDSGLWNLGSLHINIPQGRGQMPRMSLQQGSLRYDKISKGKVVTSMVVPLTAEFNLDRQTVQGYEFSVRTGPTQDGIGPSTLSGSWKPGRLHITGGLSSKDNPSLERIWAVGRMDADIRYSHLGPYHLKLDINDLSTSHSAQTNPFDLVEPVFQGTLSPVSQLQRFFGRYSPAGTVNLAMEIQGRLDQPEQSQVKGVIELRDMTIKDRTFPYAINHMTGRIDLTEDHVWADDLIGYHGDVEVRIGFDSKGFGSDWRYAIRIHSPNMALDKDLYDTLSPGQQAKWSAIDPQGRAQIDYEYARESASQKKRSLVVRPLGVLARYRGFPYPLENISGELAFEQNRTILRQLVSEYGGRRITINGQIAGSETQEPVHDLSIEVENVPLDANLASSLGKNQRSLYEQLRMTGFVQGQIQVHTDANTPLSRGFRAELTLKDASMEVWSNLIPLSSIGASVSLTPSIIEIKDLKGLYRSREVSAKATIRLDDLSKPISYHYQVLADEMSIQELTPALPTKAATVVQDLQAQGLIRLDLTLDRSADQSSVRYVARVDCLKDRIKAKVFPYPLQEITGHLTIDNNSITLEKVSAIPEVNDLSPTSRITAQGRIELAASAFSKADIYLETKDLPLDPALGNALPDPMRSYYRQAQPAGSASLAQGRVLVRRMEDGQAVWNYDGAGDLDAGVVLSRRPAHLASKWTAAGTFQTGVGFLDGTIQLEDATATYGQKSGTRFQTRIVYDPNQRRWDSNTLTGELYGGPLTGRLSLASSPGQPPFFQVQLDFIDVDLAAFLHNPDAASDKDTTTGRMGGSFAMAMRIGDWSTRLGRCQVQIEQMRTGKMSPFSQLLSVLQLNEPQDYFFERMHMEAYIRGERLWFQKFDLSGQSVAFSGTGKLNLSNDQLDLVLLARGKRAATAEPSAWQSLTEGLAGAVIRMEVTGHPYDPVVTVRPLPVIEDSLRLLGADPR